MNKKLIGYITVIVGLVLIAITFHPTNSFAVGGDISLLDIEPADEGGGVYSVNGDGQPFTDAEGNLVDVGIKLTSSGGSAYTSYNIKDMEYKTFNTKISLDPEYIYGDFGKTAIGFYADDQLLYEKQLTKNSGIIPVSIKVPENITDFYIIAKQARGAKGTHDVILSDPYFSSKGSYLYNDKVKPISPTTIGSFSDDSYYKNGWSSGNVFQDVKANLVTDGFGLSTSYNDGGTAYATYNIDNMGFNRFETKLSLDAQWTVGDYGRSAVGIYADDYLLCEKELTAKTPVQTVKLNLPKGTKNLRIIGKQFKGARGTQGIVFINPLLKKTNDPIVAKSRRVSAQTVGATDYSSYYYTKDWDTEPFRYSNGKIATEGIGLTTSGSYGGTSYAVYDITGMGFNAFQTKLSLDPIWLTGDYGKTTVYIYGDKKLLYKRTLNKKDLKNLSLRFPSKTKKVTLKIVQKRGAKGTHGVVFGNAAFTKVK